MIIVFGNIHQPLSMQNEYKTYNMKSWKRQADLYAKHILVLFNAEKTLFQSGQKNELWYTLENLQCWVKEIQDDNSLVGRLRLKAIYNHSHVLKRKFENKVLCSKFCFRNWTIWNPEDIKKLNLQSFEYKSALQDQDIINQFQYETTHSTLQNVSNKT